MLMSMSMSFKAVKAEKNTATLAHSSTLEKYAAHQTNLVLRMTRIKDSAPTT